jgi:hemerythrin-like domain-containing protein
MSNSNSPNVIAGLLSIHAIISRGLKVAVETSAAFVQKGNPDASPREGFITYLRCLASLLGVHHDTEDTLAFPAFRERVEAPYDVLTEQHQLMHLLLEEAKAEVEKAAAEPLVRLNFVLCRIEELWRPHIKIEEEHFTIDRFAALMPPQEHVRLNALFLEHAQQSWGPEYLMLPFLLYNLEPDKRSFFAAELPPVVTEQLVPVVWKEKWAPMQPFLLA